MKQFKDVIAFQKMLGLQYNGPPRHLPETLAHLRTELLKEELREYLIASDHGSITEQFDALIDLVYVALGNAYLHGFPFPEGWDLVHAANMRKVPGVSKRGLGFDARKPAGWVAPDLDSLIYGDQDGEESEDARGSADGIDDGTESADPRETERY